MLLYEAASRLWAVLLLWEGMAAVKKAVRAHMLKPGKDKGGPRRQRSGRCNRRGAGIATWQEGILGAAANRGLTDTCCSLSRLSMACWAACTKGRTAGISVFICQLLLQACKCTRLEHSWPCARQLQWCSSQLKDDCRWVLDRHHIRCCARLTSAAWL